MFTKSAVYDMILTAEKTERKMIMENIMRFKNKVAVVTGGAKGIGKCICDEFKKQGAEVCIIDVLPNGYFTGDIGDKFVIEEFCKKGYSAVRTYRLSYKQCSACYERY